VAEPLSKRRRTSRKGSIASKRRDGRIDLLPVKGDHADMLQVKSDYADMLPVKMIYWQKVMQILILLQFNCSFR